LVANRFALFGLVVVALAALFGVAWVSRPAAGQAGAAVAAPRGVPIVAAIRACPTAGSGRVAVFASPGQQTGPGRAELLTASAAGTDATGSAPATGAVVAAAPLAVYSQPGQLWLTGTTARPVRPARPAGKTRRAARPGPAAVIVKASGPMAQGLDAEQMFYPANGAAGSVTGVQCAPPGTDFWFIGPGPAKAATISVHLVNPDSQPAAVDVEIATDTGPLQGNADTGIAVPAGGSTVQSIGALVKGARVVSLHVRTSVGRVVAAVQAGGLWWPPAVAPAGHVVIPGLPSAGHGRRLFIIDPGTDDAQVHVRAITPAGSYEPAGSGGIDVPAGSAVALDLPSLDGIPAALRLTSAVPVTATVLVAGRAFTAATGPIRQQAVVADNAAGSGYLASIVLSAPNGAAQVRITTSGPAGPLGPAKVVSIAAGHSDSVSLTVPRAARAGFALVISAVPGSGPVYAGRVLATRSGGVQLITVAADDPATVVLPPISHSAVISAP
jgi:hypothetical protein